MLFFDINGMIAHLNLDNLSKRSFGLWCNEEALHEVDADPALIDHDLR